VIHGFRKDGEPVIRHVDQGTSRDASAIRPWVSKRFDGCSVGARLEPLIPPAKTGGRPRQTDMRAAINAIFYLLRTGCPWRYLPGDPFPPRSTVYNIFRKFQREGVWERMWGALLVALREQSGREASPSAAIIDSQSLKAAEKADAKAGVKATQWVMTRARR
jgi:transposase